MITWITTVGWSPFAVINPIWAYCKEHEDIPERVNLIYTPNDKIKKNEQICKDYIKEILRIYSNNSFNAKNIFEHLIENEDIETYADNLKRIIKNEMSFKPKKIILDMTPGRKYMSAVNVYYGLGHSEIPIQVNYLHLEQNKYQDVPYPLTPIIKNELIDIIDSTEVFSKDQQEFSFQEKIYIEINNQRYEIKDDLKGKETNLRRIKELLILLSILKEPKSHTQINKFLYSKKTPIKGNELRQIINNLNDLKFLTSQKMQNQCSEFIGYKLADKGIGYISELKKQLFTNNGE